jgi:hypothetical protein
VGRTAIHPAAGREFPGGRRAGVGPARVCRRSSASTYRFAVAAGHRGLPDPSWRGRHTAAVPGAIPTDTPGCTNATSLVATCLVGTTSLAASDLAATSLTIAGLVATTARGVSVRGGDRISRRARTIASRRLRRDLSGVCPRP